MAKDERFRISLGKKARITSNSWLLKKPVAHRGLHGEDVPENSALAYQLAAAHGYPIEIDIHLTADGEIVVFHDDSLARMTGAEGDIRDQTLARLKTLRLAGTDQRILTLRETLNLVRGKVPLLIEIKPQKNKGIEKKAVEILKEYKGEFAVQSFDPMIIRRVKKLAPRFFRGILATHDATNLPFFKRFALKRMPLNFCIKPDFISYNVRGLPLREGKIKNKALLAWTVNSQETLSLGRKYADNVIFENIKPE